MNVSGAPRPERDRLASAAIAAVRNILSARGEANVSWSPDPYSRFDARVHHPGGWDALETKGVSYHSGYIGSPFFFARDEAYPERGAPLSQGEELAGRGGLDHMAVLAWTIRFGRNGAPMTSQAWRAPPHDFGEIWDNGIPTRNGGEARRTMIMPSRFAVDRYTFSTRPLSRKYLPGGLEMMLEGTAPPEQAMMDFL